MYTFYEVGEQRQLAREYLNKPNLPDSHHLCWCVVITMYLEGEGWKKNCLLPINSFPQKIPFLNVPNH